MRLHLARGLARRQLSCFHVNVSLDFGVRRSKATACTGDIVILQQNNWLLIKQLFDTLIEASILLRTTETVTLAIVLESMKKEAV